MKTFAMTMLVLLSVATAHAQMPPPPAPPGSSETPIVYARKSPGGAVGIEMVYCALRRGDDGMRDCERHEAVVGGRTMRFVMQSFKSTVGAVHVDGEGDLGPSWASGGSSVGGIFQSGGSTSMIVMLHTVEQTAQGFKWDGDVFKDAQWNHVLTWLSSTGIQVPAWPNPGRQALLDSLKSIALEAIDKRSTKAEAETRQAIVDLGCGSYPISSQICRAVADGGPMTSEMGVAVLAAGAGAAVTAMELSAAFPACVMSIVASVGAHAAFINALEDIAIAQLENDTMDFVGGIVELLGSTLTLALAIVAGVPACEANVAAVCNASPSAPLCVIGAPVLAFTVSLNVYTLTLMTTYDVWFLIGALAGF